MTHEEFQRIGRQMIVEARERFRVAAMKLCRTDEQRRKAVAIEAAVGEVSPEEAVLAFKRWLAEEGNSSALPPRSGTARGKD